MSCSGNRWQCGHSAVRVTASDRTELAGVALVADAPARSIGRRSGCWRSPTCISKRARASPRAACCCRPTIPPRRWRGLARLIARYAPRCVIALGDSFHDGGGPARLADSDRATLGALQRGRDWIWIAGNHDPEPATEHRRLFRRRARDRRADVPPRADGRRDGRDRRPSASGRARVAARPHGEPPLLCRRRRAAGDAGVRRLCRRPQRARPRLRGCVRHAGLHRAYAGRADPALLPFDAPVRRAWPRFVNPAGTPPRRTSR